MTTLSFDAADLARLGEQIVKMFSPPPVVTRILLERRDGRMWRQVELMRSLYRVAVLYGDASHLARYVAFGEGKDPIPWYGLRAAHIEQMLRYYRGRMSPKAHRRLGRVLVEGMALVREAGRITEDEMKAIKRAVEGQ